MRPRRWLILGIALLALLGACGEGQQVGSEKLLDFDAQQSSGPRLGERTAPPSEDPGSLTVGATPQATPKPTPKPSISYFEVTLVKDSPYYKPGNRIVIRKGVTIRVTNSDNEPNRPGRSFTDKNGTFHSGLLKPGATWTWTFNTVAKYEVIDEGLNFATAYLEVVP